MYITWLCMTQNDYLSHLVLYGGLTEALKTFKDGEQFQLLDLGCGDAHYIADALQRSGAGGRLRQYTGVDLAGDALKVRILAPPARVFIKYRCPAPCAMSAAADSVTLQITLIPQH